MASAFEDNNVLESPVKRYFGMNLKEGTVFEVVEDGWKDFDGKLSGILLTDSYDYFKGKEVRTRMFLSQDAGKITHQFKEKEGGRTVAEGTMKELESFINDRTRQIKKCKHLFFVMKGEICRLSVHGGGYAAWIEFLKDMRKNGRTFKTNPAFTVARFEPKIYDYTTAKVPVFESFAGEIPEATMNAAREQYSVLKEYLDNYFLVPETPGETAPAEVYTPPVKEEPLDVVSMLIGERTRVVLEDQLDKEWANVCLQMQKKGLSDLDKIRITDGWLEYIKKNWPVSNISLMFDGQVVRGEFGHSNDEDLPF